MAEENKLEISLKSVKIWEISDNIGVKGKALSSTYESSDIRGRCYVKEIRNNQDVVVMKYFSHKDDFGDDFGTDGLGKEELSQIYKKLKLKGDATLNPLRVSCHGGFGG
ncbi:MAG: hypothetical protein WCX73_04535 [Candidatus Pacearchaeota archaeon]